MTSSDILAGMTAVITGGGRDIGSAIALELASHGTNVAVNHFCHKEQAEETATAVEAAGGRAIVVRAHAGEIEGGAAARRRERGGVRWGGYLL